MKSPFSGMDPFIEGCGLWEDFHTHLIEEIYRGLADVVPDRYVVRSGERSYLSVGTEEITKQRPFKPDVTINAPKDDSALNSAESVAVMEPDDLTMRAFVEEEFREPYIEILETGPESRLVTCIEVLSPSNKKPNSVGSEQYLRKRRGLLQGHETNLVEIDLVRGGKRMPMVDPWPASPFTYLIARASSTPVCRVRPVHFRKPVPALAVPLSKPDADVSVELQPMIDAIYARSKYGRTIDYRQALTPPLSAEDLQWLTQRLGEQSNATS